MLSSFDFCYLLAAFYQTFQEKVIPGLKSLTLYLQHNDHSPEDIECSQGRRRLPIDLKQRIFEAVQPEAMS